MVNNNIRIFNKMHIKRQRASSAYNRLSTVNEKKKTEMFYHHFLPSYINVFPNKMYGIIIAKTAYRCNRF